MNRISMLVLAVVAVILSWPMVALAATTADGNTPIRDLSTFAVWSIVGGAITSIVTAFINRHAWPSDVKLGVFFGLCAFTAAVNAYFNGDLNGAEWIRSMLIVVASGWTTYLAAKPAIKTIEARTG